MEKKGLFKVLIATVVIVALSVLIVGAIWSNNLAINGTAHTGKFDVRYIPGECSITSLDSLVTVSALTFDTEEKMVSYDVDNLYPSDNPAFKMTITMINNGTIPAKLNASSIVIDDPDVMPHLKGYCHVTAPGISKDILPINSPFDLWDDNINVDPQIDMMLLQPGEKFSLDLIRMRLEKAAGPETMDKLVHIDMSMDWQQP